MMSNAARARSLGLELAAEYNYKGLSASVGYGYTNARFRDYDDGMESYGGNFLPYAPQNTINALVGYTWHIADSRLEEITITADWRGIGRIYWNESNTLSQPLYSLLGMQLSLGFKKATLTIWGRNLTNSDYDTFYFKSVGKEFFSKGAPIHGGIRVNINI
jgi:outer membrane receptor protein involved in Fe transport